MPELLRSRYAPLPRKRVSSRARPLLLAGTPVRSRRSCYQLLISWLWQAVPTRHRGRFHPCLPREKLTFTPEGALCPPAGQVLAALTTAPTREAAQEALWHWLLPALRTSLREQNLRRLDRLTALFEELEHQLAAVYHLRENTPAGRNLQPPAPGTGHR